MPDPPDWVLSARKFVATDKREFLAEAAQHCPDAEVRQFLAREDVGGNHLLPDEVFQPLVERLQSQGRTTEAAVVEILGLRFLASVADESERLRPEIDALAEGSCRHLAARSHDQGLAECEAVFLCTLGTREGKRHRWPAATGLLGQALAIYRELAQGEPHIYRPDVATTLNNLGNVLREERKFPEARGAFQEALGIYRGLAQAKPDIYRRYVATILSNLGNVLFDERKFPEARGALDQALGIYRKLAQREPHIYRPDVAMTLNNLGNVLSEERKFPEARGAFKKALGIRRELAHLQPHVYRPYVATTLNNLGIVLRQERNFAGARGAFREGLGIYRALRQGQRDIYRPDVARALNNLGIVLRDERKVPEARRAFKKALGIFRELAHVEPHIYRPYVAGTLNNLGNVLDDEQKFPEARAAFDEALDIHRELARVEPHIYRPYVAATLNNLGSVLEHLRLDQEARSLSEEAVAAAEAGDRPARERFLAKGMALGAYHRLLRSVAREGHPARVFRCLAAMREGQVQALGDEPSEGLEAAAAALGRASQSAGRQIRVLVAQTLTQECVLLAVLQPDPGCPLLYAEAARFRQRAAKLFDEIRMVFDKATRREAGKARALVRQLAEAAWGELPDFVRQTLDPRAGHDVLVSGDRYWNAFPWEALCHGPGEDDWLGLGRPLVRWGPLTAPALDRLRPITFGGGRRTAAVACPWDVPGQTRLELARKEAEAVAKQLAGLGYGLVPGGEPAMGKAATPKMLAAMLEEGPAVVHYTGHGTILGNEEVLVLWDDDPKSRSYAPFGRKEIVDLKYRLGRTGPLLEGGPLVFLNSCMTGQTRDFGGQREDLAWTLMEEGAEAVVACALPVFETMGVSLGGQMYNGGLSRQPAMAGHFAVVRAVIEAAFRSADSPLWPAWTLMHYHGNPFARLPHVAQPGPGGGPGWGTAGGFLGALAQWLGLRSAEEAEELLDHVRGRLAGGT